MGLDTSFFVFHSLNSHIQICQLLEKDYCREFSSRLLLLGCLTFLENHPRQWNAPVCLWTVFSAGPIVARGVGQGGQAGPRPLHFFDL